MKGFKSEGYRLALFPEAATDGNKLIIRQGKTGSRGQASLKTFADDEAARDEMNRLEEEQKRKGYRPSGNSTDSRTAL